MAYICGHCGTTLPQGKRRHDPRACRDLLWFRITDMRAELEKARPYDRNFVIQELRRRIEYRGKRVATETRGLSTSMDAVARRLDSDPSNSVNPSGEVQRQGAEIDRLCAEIGMLRHVLELLDADGEATAHA